VFVVASVTTAVLSLDATVVLLTPVVIGAAARVGARPKPHAYACTHLANSASLLLPVSNLTNLLAFAASGLSFTRFAALMALPWLAGPPAPVPEPAPVPAMIRWAAINTMTSRIAPGEPATRQQRWHWPDES
jgi:hypothetical protein